MDEHDWLAEQFMVKMRGHALCVGVSASSGRAA
jgi:hypothetical protein